MDWKSIKTIFIFSFLILNIYLGTQFYEKRYQEFDTLKEETLKKLDAIKYNKEYPEIPEKLSLASGTATLFDDKMIKEFTDKNKKQDVSVFGDKIINSKLKDPIDISSSSEEEVVGHLQNFINSYVPNADQYEYWKYDRDRHLHLFRQIDEQGIPFYFNDYITQDNLTGLIEVSLNEKDEITSYRLTSMDITKQQEEQKLITAKEALLVDAVTPETTVKDIKPVYFTLITNGGWKVFVPSWHIVTEKQELMVDATDSSVISLEKDEEESEE
ncbi:two-component system regulatory protein YycI [Pseudalkalibacillus sp. R45]|uniref:two-component system regulatory protein YycI n=1 Tax=Pseudalkalibacillus sp. R45 TaxID=3457433 RepID=UPI003FCE0B9F